MSLADEIAAAGGPVAPTPATPTPSAAPCSTSRQHRPVRHRAAAERPPPQSPGPIPGPHPQPAGRPQPGSGRRCRLPEQPARQRHAGQHQRTGGHPEHAAGQRRQQRPGEAAQALQRGFDGVAQRRDAVHEDAAAHQEHRRRAGHREALHQPRRRCQDAAPQSLRRAAAAAAQRQPGVVELDDAGHEAVDTHRHHDGHAREHQHLRRERGVGHGAQRDGDDLGREDEVGANRALDLVLLEGHQVDRRVGQRLLQPGTLGLDLLLRMQETVRQLLEALVAEEGAAEHEQRRHQPRREGTDDQRRGHEDGLVDERALGHRPDHRQFAVGAEAGDLLRVQRQVVAEHPGGLLRSELGQQCHVVENGGDVV